ncbi:hypothetical protein LVY65_02830 [Sphingomonas sp. G124]|uniref:Uncharacterized protein n=1 Tax=Sphingomonas cremea TaxID=2904799 RepID=A0A9X1QIG4_9SPHN|nr:hypothetical protein [Sphingomonas cremea]MCF2514005.1 hypothetical protein [Sphingomonas cremea]
MPAHAADAIRIMSGFAERTGLTSDAGPKRYLWTDAFALCNWLELYRESRDERYRDLAATLIEQVHLVLGRHRPDDSRTGWLSGLPEEEGALHPTAGGLRIGKPLPERRTNEPFDDRLEWEREGQYFHYLTKWIDALIRAAVILDAPHFRTQAAELAKAVFRPFLLTSPSGRPVGLSWKMSMDLSRPLVAGSNPHDALDGYVTYRLVEEIGGGSNSPQISSEINVLRQLCIDVQWGTSDPLGIGGLLLDAFRLATLPDLQTSEKQLLGNIIFGAEAGVQQFLRSGAMQGQPAMRLAFRELGLAIGLQALPAIAIAANRLGMMTGSIAASLSSLLSFGKVDRAIVDFWSELQNQRVSTWQDHRDINEVMLVAAILHSQVGTAPLPAPQTA